MTIKEIISLFLNELKYHYPEQEIRSIAYASLEHVMGFSRAEVFLNISDNISEEKLTIILDILQKLKRDMPLQYITGAANFYGLNFVVNSSVLIPRPETEELVDWIIKENKDRKVYILDIGTGSGCIGIALKKFIPESMVFALDISEKALSVASENAKLNRAEVTFLQYDILKNSNESLFQPFDIIVSNPPYIKESEKALMRKNVLNYEPAIALFTDDKTPLVFYSAIADFALKKLKPGGSLFFEINENCGDNISLLLKESGFFEVQLRKDINKKERMLKCLQPG